LISVKEILIMGIPAFKGIGVLIILTFIISYFHLNAWQICALLMISLILWRIMHKKGGFLCKIRGLMSIEILKGFAMIIFIVYTIKFFGSKGGWYLFGVFVFYVGVSLWIRRKHILWAADQIITAIWGQSIVDTKKKGKLPKIKFMWRSGK
jgi:hypothetical protein